MKENRLKYKNFRIIGYVLLLGVLILTGCEGYRCAGGNIYDAETKAPLDSVQCKCLTSYDIQYSDSTGYYVICNGMSGCVPDCPDIEVEYSKPGYKTLKITNPDKNDIFLDKETD